MASNEVQGLRYSQDAFRAYILAASTFAWYAKQYRRDYLPANTDVDDSTNFQCYRPGRITDPRWRTWIDEALKYRVVTTGVNPAIYFTGYKAGSSGTCSNTHAGVADNEMSQNGLKYFSEHCSYDNWRDLTAMYYPGSQVKLVQVPVRPTTGSTRFDQGVVITFLSRVRHPTTLNTYSVAWGFEVSRKIGAGAWRTQAVLSWDEATRSIPGAFTSYYSGCARYRVRAFNPRYWDAAKTASPWTYVNGNQPLAPSGVTC